MDHKSSGTLHRTHKEIPYPFVTLITPSYPPTRLAPSLSLSFSLSPTMSSDPSAAMVDLEDEDDLTPSLQNLIDQQSLKWIFCGGKGGVGKTTTSCSLAVQLSQARESVLLVSTDPAHNLSDAFGQKFSKNPTLIEGFSNLYAMEIDPTIEVESGDVLDSNSAGMIAELASSIPGIDEAMSFAELMKQVQTMKYSVIVFDTAPTGHTLRLLSFPSVLEKAFEKFQTLKSRFSGIFNQVSGMVGAEREEKMLDKLTQARETIELINQAFKDPEHTTFVCVCMSVEHITQTHNTHRTHTRAHTICSEMRSG